MPSNEAQACPLAIRAALLATFVEWTRGSGTFGRLFYSVRLSSTPRRSSIFPRRVLCTPI